MCCCEFSSLCLLGLRFIPRIFPVLAHCPSLILCATRLLSAVEWADSKARTTLRPFFATFLSPAAQPCSFASEVPLSSFWEVCDGPMHAEAMLTWSRGS